MTRAVRMGRALVLAPLLAAVLASGCTGDDPSPEPGNEPARSQESGPPSAKTQATIEVISGKLAKQRRRPLRRKVTEVVDGWVEAAYLGDYPRSDFGKAFSAFTPLARREARRASGLMSNHKIGGRLESVRATKRQYRIDALAVDNKPAGVTVRITLGLALAGEVERRDKVTGRVHLSKVDNKWRIFGFDVERRQR
jgi:hypothetical protein